MPIDPHAALQALLRAEAVRATPPEAPPTTTSEHDADDPQPGRPGQQPTPGENT
ncbi:MULTISPECIES: hypothetical protein [Streptomyces]|nr:MULTISPECIES: hypothetical protein [Streptomyces]MYZ12955.1 hypothetical protein [Streptomyces sp. SID337]NDZ99722.1 hypothetical protein [Streptomyces sp. SID10116]MYY82992.1 hypothetical protein [Streptomyces sp. SID335]NDZ87845.1 hypothetical protein [Streptomyces sp. SID10115]NEB48623.1 hypothetical protein [Streptomyces sp. SID339]